MLHLHWIRSPSGLSARGEPLWRGGCVRVLICALDLSRSHLCAWKWRLPVREIWQKPYKKISKKGSNSVLMLFFFFYLLVAHFWVCLQFWRRMGGWDKLLSPCHICHLYSCRSCGTQLQRFQTGSLEKGEQYSLEHKQLKKPAHKTDLFIHSMIKCVPKTQLMVPETCQVYAFK